MAASSVSESTAALAFFVAAAMCSSEAPSAENSPSESQRR